MQKRDILNSPRLLEIKKRRRKIFLRKFSIFVFLVLVLIASLTYLSRLSRLNITEIKISGNQVTETENIKNVVNDTLSGNYFWFFPKTNIFLYSKNKIIEALATKFQRLKDVNIKTDQNRVLEISVTERIPKYTWCGEVLPDNADGISSCYFLDDTGFIFDEAPQFAGSVYFKFFGKTTGNENPIGSAIIPDYFKDFILFKNSLENIGIKPVGFYRIGDGYAKIYLSSNTTSFGPEIIFKENSDFQKLSENLQSALDVEPFHTDFVKKYYSLLYINLSFGNKVVYKFKP